MYYEIRNTETGNRDTFHALRKITYEFISKIMQNKANVKDAQISVSSYMKRIYAKIDTWWIGKNKAKTNPIQSQLFQRAKFMQSVYIQRIKNRNAAMGWKNKAKQSQS